ncbi:hypothetical protein ACP8Y2_15010 [Herpetosiphon llansteffanensis]
MTQPAAPSTPLLHNRYRVQARLGENRLALVFRATDERLSRSVLVHLLRPDLLENAQLRKRFNDEAQGLAKRTHPGLLDVYDNGEVGNRPYMITEDVDGELLRDRLPLSAERALEVLRQVVGAVSITITTQTPTPPIGSRAILLTSTDRAVLIEPWWLSNEELRADMQAYRAPERLNGGAPDERSVVYSLGLLGYELLTGITPDATTKDLPSIYQQVNGFVPSLVAALHAATTNDPNQRTATVAALARDLAAVDSAADAPTKQLVRPLPALRDTMRDMRQNLTQRRTQPTPTPPPRQAPSASAAPNWNVAPPKPMMPPRQASPPIQQQAVQQPPAQYYAPQPSPPVQQGISREELRSELRSEIRRETYRRGCLNFIWRRAFGLGLITLLVVGCVWGFTFGRNWLLSGAAKTWACGYIPSWACNLLPGTQTETYVIIQDNTPVYTNQDRNSALVVTLPRNTEVIIRDPATNLTSNGWAKIEINDYQGRRITGWIDSLNMGKPQPTVKPDEPDLPTTTGELIFKTSQESNVRSTAEYKNDGSNIIMSIPANTRVVAPDPNAIVTQGGIVWINIVFEKDGQAMTGWISRDLLQQEETP